MKSLPVAEQRLPILRALPRAKKYLNEENRVRFPAGKGVAANAH
jgi:hypothetical protein